MEKESKVGKRIMLFTMAILLIASPLSPNMTLAQPKPEGTLRIALATLAEEGFLTDMGDSNQATVYPLVYDYPFFNDERTDELIPGLAKRFEYSKDNLTLTLHLREGVPFQDGWGEVTAEDFKYSYERAMRETSTSTRKELYDDLIKSIEVLDRYKIAFHLKKVAPEFWIDFSEMENFYVGILCKKYVETVGEEKARLQPIGTGPYRLVERKTGQYLKFEAFEQHWRVVPEFKYIIVQMIPEESTRIAMLKSAETDIIPISPLSMAELQKEKGIRVEPWPGGYHPYLAFGGMMTPKDARYKAGYHLTDPWAKDLRVRQAMNMAIDREAIVKAIYKGAARPMSICWGLTGWDKLPPIPYDPKKAKQLLIEAGYPNGFNLVLSSVNDFAPAFELPEITEIVAAYFKAIGLNPTIKMVDKATLFGTCRAGTDVGAVYGWKMSYRTSYSGQFNDKFYPSPSGSGQVQWTNDELVALIDAYDLELDIQKRAAALTQVRDYFYNNHIGIPLVMASPVWASRDAVVGEWPKSSSSMAHHFEYVRHPTPLNTWRLFTPGQ